MPIGEAERDAEETVPLQDMARNSQSSSVSEKDVELDNKHAGLEVRTEEVDTGAALSMLANVDPEEALRVRSVAIFEIVGTPELIEPQEENRLAHFADDVQCVSDLSLQNFSLIQISSHAPFSVVLVRSVTSSGTIAISTS